MNLREASVEILRRLRTADEEAADGVGFEGGNKRSRLNCDALMMNWTDVRSVWDSCKLAVSLVFGAEKLRF